MYHGPKPFYHKIANLETTVTVAKRNRHGYAKGNPIACQLLVESASREPCIAVVTRNGGNLGSWRISDLPLAITDRITVDAGTGLQVDGIRAVVAEAMRVLGRIALQSVSEQNKPSPFEKDELKLTL